MGQRRAENGANVGETCGLQQRGRLKKKRGGRGEVGQGGVWCQRPGGQREEGHHAGGGGGAVGAAVKPEGPEETG